MLIKSAIITSLSGSVGGLTGSHNAGGMYFRGRAIPVNPNSPAQQVIRGAVATLTSHWTNTLTAAQRAAWADYADNVPLVGPLGDPRKVPALAHYVRSNVPRINAGLPRVDAGPTVFNLGDFTAPSFGNAAAATDDFDVTIDNTDDWANEDDSAMIIQGSRPQNGTINYFKGPYQFAGNIDGDSVTPPTSPASITNPFAFAVDNRVFVAARVSRADGRLSLPFRGFVVGV